MKHTILAGNDRLTTKGKYMVSRMLMGGLLISSLLLMQGCMWTRAEHSFDLQKALGFQNVVPLVIIGSGSAGLPAAIYGARSMIKTVVIKGPLPGGLLTQTTDVENWPGEQLIMGPNLIGNMEKHAQKLGVEFMHDTVLNIDFSSWPYTIETDNGKELHALSIILATGATPFTLGIPGEQEYWGRGVGTCAVCDAAFYKNEDVVVVGGGDSAIEEAIQLAQYAKSVTILVRKDKMRAAARMQQRLKGYPTITIRYNVQVQKVMGDEHHVTGIELLDATTNEVNHMAVSGLFLAIGHTPNSLLVKGSVTTDDNGYILTKGKTQETSITGVFAAGEVEDNRYRQAIVSAGRGASAALDAVNFLTELGFTPSMASQFKGALQVEELKIEELPSLGSLADLGKITQSTDALVVLDFYTDTCPTCLQMMPLVASVAGEFIGKAQFFKVNAEQAVDLAQKFFVYKVPCLVVVKKDTLLARYHETMNRQELKDFVSQFITAEQAK
ncbi:MAG: FAD-dependent oxidoreductase [Candidatus Babeliales bacterium]